MINMIAAVDNNLGIGKNNDLLIHIKEDLLRFKNLTFNKTIVMGYKTYLSLPKKPLQNRKNIVITSKNISLEGCEVIHDIKDLFQITTQKEEVFIIGGGMIYKQYMKYADKLFITRILNDFSADTFFPNIDKNIWECTSLIKINKNKNCKFDYNFEIYEKIKKDIF